MNLRAKRLPLCHESEHRSRSFPWYYTKPRHVLSALLWLSEGRMCLFIHALKEGLLRTEGHGSEMSVSNKQYSHYWFNLQTMWSKFPGHANFYWQKTVKFLTPSSSLILDRTTQKSNRQADIFSCALVFAILNRSSCRWRGQTQSTVLLQMPGLLHFSYKMDK